MLGRSARPSSSRTLTPVALRRASLTSATRESSSCRRSTTSTEPGSRSSVSALPTRRVPTTVTSSVKTPGRRLSSTSAGAPPARRTWARATEKPGALAESSNPPGSASSAKRPSAPDHPLTRKESATRRRLKLAPGTGEPVESMTRPRTNAGGRPLVDAAERLSSRLGAERGAQQKEKGGGPEKPGRYLVLHRGLLVRLARRRRVGLVWVSTIMKLKTSFIIEPDSSRPGPGLSRNEDGADGAGRRC